MVLADPVAGVFIGGSVASSKTNVPGAALAHGVQVGAHPCCDRLDLCPLG
jgi:hypothetical protein